jgi:peptidoglycan hydrolase-like protein with peptidoglycan-binding domain
MLFAGLMALMPALASASSAKSKTAKSSSFGSRTLKQGMSGPDVKTLQSDLTSLNFTVTPTGNFNGVTASRVKQFQRKMKITADGVVGPKTFSMLRQALTAAVEAPDASATSTGSTAPLPQDESGGAGFVPTNPSDSAPVQDAILGSDGLATAPTDAPAVIVNLIAAANKIALDPYVYGGGHNDNWNIAQSGYDCSGSVSYALHGGGLLPEPLDSDEFISYGDSGPGKWITIYADDGHAFMEVAGLWFDTVNAQYNSNADRWSTSENAWEKTQDYTERHPDGW